MNEHFDIIILGTGLKECIMSGLASTSKKKVLHMDRNSYYGAESASLNLEDLFHKFRGADAAPPKELGRPRDYCVDLVPKFLMACGDLVKMLLHTRVTRYLEFKVVAGSYVVKKGKPFKVPATAREALGSDLLGFFQKRHYRNFLEYVGQYEAEDPKTHKGRDLRTMTARKLMSDFSLDDNTVFFTGHCIALYMDDKYLDQPALEMVERVKLYAYSLSRYGQSPFIYPLWGIGNLPEAFSRLSAVHGGVYMLNKPVDEILYDAEGKVKGVRCGEETATCTQLIADPSYFAGTEKVKKVGQVARMICILSHPVAGTNDDSAQIIIPAAEAKRNSDIYVSTISYHHKIAPTGKYIAVASTQAETKEPEQELAPALALFGQVEQKFFWVQDVLAPTGDGKADNVFISSGYDATSHFESATQEALAMYESVFGHKMNLDISADPEDLQDPGQPEMEVPTDAELEAALREQQPADSL